jgi:hypothetical protein
MKALQILLLAFELAFIRGQNAQPEQSNTYEIDSDVVEKTKKLLEQPKLNTGQLNSILKSGDINGFYTPSQVYGLVYSMNTIYPQYVTAPIAIKESYQHRPIMAFQLGELKDTSAKSQVLFTGLHHAREPVSLAMILKIFLVKLHELIHRGPGNHFFDHSDILFLPIINIDGYSFISENFNRTGTLAQNLKRKNFNHTVPCYTSNRKVDEVNSGVDLNRNYDFKFGLDEEGSVANPCDEIYRGAAPFSEPETQAVKFLVEKSGKVGSAMNFHAYGNLWITPYCYYKNKDYEKLMTPEVFAFYRSFESEIKSMGFLKTGSAEETISYVANGEASDWMLGRHGIISFSPELGNDKQDTDNFFPPKEKIPEILDFEFPVIKAFFARHRPIISKISIKQEQANITRLSISTTENVSGDSDRRVLVFNFEHQGLIEMHGLRTVMFFTDPNFGSAVETVSLRSGKVSISEIPVKLYLDKSKLILKRLIRINKLSANQLRFNMKSPAVASFRVVFYKGKKKVFEVSSGQDLNYLTLIGGDLRQKRIYLSFIFCFVLAFVALACLISRRQNRTNGYNASPIDINTLDHERLKVYP